MALPTQEEAYEAGLQSIKDCLKRLRPQLKPGDKNRTQYDNLDLIDVGNYVGVIERHRIYTTNQGSSGTALVISFKGIIDRKGNFTPGRYGSYETYFNHSKDYSWNKLLALYEDLGFVINESPDVVDVDPVGYLVECTVGTGKTNTKHFIKYIYAASKPWPIEGQPEPGADIFQGEDDDKSATPPETTSPSPDDTDAF